MDSAHLALFFEKLSGAHLALARKRAPFWTPLKRAALTHALPIRCQKTMANEFSNLSWHCKSWKKPDKTWNAQCDKVLWDDLLRKSWPFIKKAEDNLEFEYTAIFFTEEEQPCNFKNVDLHCISYEPLTLLRWKQKNIHCFIMGAQKVGSYRRFWTKYYAVKSCNTYFWLLTSIWPY